MSYPGTCHLEVPGSGMLDSDRKWCLCEHQSVLP